MKHNREKNDIVELVLHVEDCVRRWEYTSIYAGQSSVFALFLIFLKCMDDRKHNDAEGFFSALALNSEKKTEHYLNTRLNDFYIDIIKTDSCDSSVFELFAKRVDFDSAPKSFEMVLEILQEADFTKEENVGNLIKAIQKLYRDAPDELDIHKNVQQMDSTVVMLAKEILGCCESFDIYGFACGTGTFLSWMADNGSTVYAQEADLEKAIVAYMLLRLEQEKLQDMHFKLNIGDVLEQTMTLDIPEQRFDRVAVKLPVGKRKTIADKLRMSEQREEFLFPDGPIDTSAWLYVRHIMKKLKKDGRAVVIAGVGELSREGNSAEDRKNLLVYGAIEAVIQLPARVGAGIRSCMLVLHRNTDRQKVYMADLERTVHSVEKEDIDIHYNQLIDMISKKIEMNGMSKYVSYDEIGKQGWNLTPAVYLCSLGNLFQEQSDLDELLRDEIRLTQQYETCQREYMESVNKYYNLKIKTGGNKK